MATMNISLPEEMKVWVESQINTGKFGNSSDLMRDLIRREQERLECIAHVDREIERGIASGFVKYDRKAIEKRLGLKPKQSAKKSAKKSVKRSARYAA